MQKGVKIKYIFMARNTVCCICFYLRDWTSRFYDKRLPSASCYVNFFRNFTNNRIHVRPAHTRGLVAGTSSGDKLLSVHCIGRMLQGQYGSRHILGVMLRGHVAGTCCSDSFPRVTSPFLRKGLLRGQNYDFWIANGAFLLVLAIL